MTRKIAVAAVLLLSTLPFAHAQRMGRAPNASPGASQLSPGNEMRNGMDADDRGRGTSSFGAGHDMKGRGTVGQSRGRGDFDRDGGGRRGFDRDSEHRTMGQSRGGRDSIDSRGDSDRGASEFSPGSRMREGGDADRR